MVIFGWGFQTTKNIGPVFQIKCPHCNNEKFWLVDRIITWFTLFFVPIVPYSFKHFLKCSICEHGLVLNSKQSEKIKELAKINQMLLEGTITDVEYTKEIDKIDINPNDFENVNYDSTNTDQSSVKFCKDCGSKVVDQDVYCGKCGSVQNRT